jgi:hypothetical protein
MSFIFVKKALISFSMKMIRSMSAVDNCMVEIPGIAANPGIFLPIYAFYILTSRCNSFTFVSDRFLFL